MKKTVLEIFEETSHMYEEVIAITDGKRKISYGTLDKRANGLARYLKKSGVFPKTIVAVYLEL